MIDQKLWAQCQKLATIPRPAKLPHFLGKILGCQVWLVDWDRVLVAHDMDAHDANNYLEEPKFIPKNHIWLDDRVLEREWPFNLYHEAHEVRDMQRGLTYETAHAKANAGEKLLRKAALEAVPRMQNSQ